MKQIDFSKKISYIQALFLPFKITPGYMVVSLANMIIKLVLAPLEVLSIANFIDAAILAVQNSSNETWKRAFVWLGLILFIKVYKCIEEPLLSLLSKLKDEKEWLAIDYPAIKVRANLNIKHLENSDTNDMISRVASPAGSLCGMLQNVINLVVFVGQIISYIIILISNAPIFGSVILLSSIPIIFLAHKSALAQFKIKKDTTKSERLVWTLNDYLRSRDAVSERNLFSYHDFIENKLHQEFHVSRKNVLKSEISWGMKKSISGFMLTMLCAIVIFLLLPAVSSGTVSIGIYISLVRYLFSASEDITYNLSPYIEKIANDLSFLKEYNQYIALSRMPEAIDPSATTVEPFESIEFKNVSFVYPGTDKVILKNVSFRMEAGKHYSLIGINGSGKSTLIKLILRFYDDYQGEILLNGKSIREWKISEIKALFFAVFQDFVHYDISIADNISSGKGMRATAEEIENAICVSHLSETVSILPNGKDTLLGTIDETGTELSGGQWQKIALARAIVNTAAVKIFDEPTASLDPISERDVYEQFEKISKGATTIFISHRLACCVNADQILLLDQGTIAEQGTHQELMDKNGKYAEMFESQRGWYI